MSYLIPGKVIKKISIQTGELEIRYPKWNDIDEMVTYINNLSFEDIYLTYSGETVTKEGEMYYLAEVFKAMERGDSIYLGCYSENRIIGSCTITRDILSRKRGYHVGIFGITMAKEFRGMGLGFTLAQHAIQEAIGAIDGLKLLTLSVYSPNTAAQKLYKKLGFIEGGRIPEAVWYRGGFVDEIKMYRRLH